MTDGLRARLEDWWFEAIELRARKMLCLLRDHRLGQQHRNLRAVLSEFDLHNRVRIQEKCTVCYEDLLLADDIVGWRANWRWWWYDEIPLRRDEGGS